MAESESILCSASSSGMSDVQTESEAESETESEQEYYVVNSSVSAYQDEPIAMPGENERNAMQLDEDGLLPATLRGRFDGEIPLSDWYVNINICAYFRKLIIKLNY